MVEQLSDKLSDLAGSPSSLTLDGLRLLERKTATVCTLLKASVYSIVLQQQIFNESEEQQQQAQQQQAQQEEMEREMEREREREREGQFGGGGFEDESQYGYQYGHQYQYGYGEESFGG